MAERLASLLHHYAKKKGGLGKAASLLEERDSSSMSTVKDSNQDIKELVAAYRKKQAEDRTSKPGPSKSKTPSVQAKSVQQFSLHFARYHRKGRFGYAMVPPGKIHIPGFKNKDSHDDVIRKGAKGLGITSTTDHLSLLVSCCLVRDAPLSNGLPWTLGGYTDEFGGVQARGKRTFGIFVDEVDDSNEEDSEELEDKSSLKESVETHLGVLPIASSTERGTIRSNPIDICSESEPLVIDYCEKMNTSFGIYCPVLTGELIIPNIEVKGREGVWQIVHYECHTSINEVMKVLPDHFNLQPETENFFLVELHSGGTTYLKMQDNLRQDIPMQDIKFYFKETRVVHSNLVLEFVQSPTPLLVLSPHHGRVKYQWFWKRSYAVEWETVDVPTWTCLLYAYTTGMYKCIVEDNTIEFHVRVCHQLEKNEKSRTSNSDNVQYEDIQFGDLIGRGTFGTVYKGIWNQTEVALKIPIPPGTEKSLILSNNREIAALRALQHPNIVSLFAHTTTSEHLILIMEFVNGRTLDELIFGKKHEISKASDVQRVIIAQKIASGVQFMHTRNPVIIHQDLKPLNVIVTDDLQRVSICDMGIAKIKSPSDVTLTTISEGPKGTIPYMAPEMFYRSHRGTAVDVYSLGCLFIELFGQRRVWPRLQGMEIMQMVCGSFKTPPVMLKFDHLPANYHNLCSSCCQLEASDRPNIDTVLRMLDIKV